MSLDPRQFASIRTQRARRLATAVALGGLAVGCAPQTTSPAGVVLTEHLHITTTSNNPICAGTSILLEDELHRIAQALRLPLWPEDDKLDVRFGPDSIAEICTDLDPEQTSGCIRRVDGELILNASEVAYTSSHELVHALRLSNGIDGPPLFEEGLAILLAGSDGFPVYPRYPRGDAMPGPSELLDVPAADFGPYYPSALSFMSWLWETRDRTALLEFLGEPSVGNFESRLGLSLAEAEQQWRNDDRPEPIGGAPCVPERTYSLADGPLELTGSLDCNEPAVYGASAHMSLWPMCLEVPQTTRVRIELEADHGRLAMLLGEPCDPGPSSAEARRDKYVDAGDPIETDIAGCYFRMLLSSNEPGFPATDYSLRIEPLDG